MESFLVSIDHRLIRTLSPTAFPFAWTAIEVEIHFHLITMKDVYCPPIKVPPEQVLNLLLKH